jgi:hypothetical protein
MADRPYNVLFLKNRISTFLSLPLASIDQLSCVVVTRQNSQPGGNPRRRHGGEMDITG